MKPTVESLHRHPCAGFSLIEMVVSITVLGILSASAAVFLRGPITSYFDAERRANLSDAGGVAMAKLSLEIARAVPNSVRVATVGTDFYLEFLPVISEGRYRAGGPGNVLTFGLPDTGFDVLMCASSTGLCTTSGTSWVVVNNHLPTENVWAGSSRAGPTVVAGSTISYPADTFALPVPATVAPDHRFQIAGQPVSYVCRAGELRRYSGYGNPQAVQPTVFGVGAQNNLLASDITACRATVLAGTLRRAQVVALALNFANAGDFLNIAHTVRVEPMP